MYYNDSQLLSYNADISCVYDFRGGGKSTSLLKRCFDLATKHEKLVFIWCRRTHKELKEIVESGTFGKDIEELFPGVMRGYSVSLVGKNVVFTKEYPSGKKRKFIGGCVCYYGQYQGKKGIQYPHVKLLVVDEIMSESGKYLKGEYTQFLSIIDSVFRKRKPRVVCLGNPTSVANPYFENWNITKLEKGFTRVKDKSVVIEYGTFTQGMEERKETHVGKLTEGTIYGGYANNAMFMLDDPRNIVDKPPKGKITYLLNILCNNRLIAMYRVNGLYYFEDAKDKTRKTLSIYLEDAKEGKAILIDKKSPLMKSISTYVLKDKCLYKNQSVKNEILILAQKHVGGC